MGTLKHESGAASAGAPAGRISEPDGSLPARLPTVGAERLGGQALLIKEVGPGERVAPCVTHRFRIGQGGAGNNDALPVNDRVGPFKFPVGARNRESLEPFAVAGRQSFARVLELDQDPAPLDLVALVERP